MRNIKIQLTIILLCITGAQLGEAHRAQNNRRVRVHTIGSDTLPRKDANHAEDYYGCIHEVKNGEHIAYWSRKTSDGWICEVWKNTTCKYDGKRKGPKAEPILSGGTCKQHKVLQNDY